jgi:hypothetical protein
MLAVISALREWRCYLEGSRFTIVTDHEPNTYLDSDRVAGHTIKRRARWLVESSSYEYTWRYRPGKVNVADPISCAPQHFAQICIPVSVQHLLKTKQQFSCGRNATLVACCALCCSSYSLRSRSCGHKTVPPTKANRDDALDRVEKEIAHDHAGTHDLWEGGDASVRMHEIELRDKDQDEILQFESNAIPTEDEQVVSHWIENEFVTQLLSAYRRTPFSQEYGNIIEWQRDKHGLCWSEKNQLIVPDDSDICKECIESVHSHPYAGHYGVNRALQQAKRSYYWPGLAKDVESFVSTCDSCQRVEARRQKPYGELQPLQIPGRRWESVSMDLITDLPQTKAG